MAEENRKKVNAEIEALKAKASEKALSAAAEADARIAQARKNARAGIREAAAEAAGSIVERLLGESVTADEAAKAG